MKEKFHNVMMTKKCRGAPDICRWHSMSQLCNHGFNSVLNVAKWNSTTKIAVAVAF